MAQNWATPPSLQIYPLRQPFRRSQFRACLAAEGMRVVLVLRVYSSRTHSAGRISYFTAGCSTASSTVTWSSGNWVFAHDALGEFLLATTSMPPHSGQGVGRGSFQEVKSQAG